jgi:transposase
MPATTADPGRDIVDAIRYLAHNGNVWRALPADFRPGKPSTTTTPGADGTVNRIHNTLREQVRTVEGRQPTPT